MTKTDLLTNITDEFTGLFNLGNTKVVNTTLEIKSKIEFIKDRIVRITNFELDKI